MKSSTFCILFVSIISHLIIANEIKTRSFPGIEGTIAAFGDFDSNKFTDIFLIRNEQHCLQIIFQIPQKTEQDAQIFEERKELRNICMTIDPTGKSKNQRIVSIIPSDFDGDALMDVAVVTTRGEKENRYSLVILKGKKTNLTDDKLYFNDANNITTQPLLLDINGDMISDLLVAELDETTGKTSYFVILGGSFERKAFDAKNEEIKVKNPNSNAYIDLNSDGVSDIFIEEHKKMTYYLAGDDGFANADKNVKEIKYPDEYKVIGASTFCDINSDEKIDHLIPVCKDKFDKTSCSIIVRDPVQNSWVKLVDKIKVNNVDYYFEEAVSSNGHDIIKLPIRLRHGYVNENGYTDLMALMKNSVDETWHVVLFNNRRSEDKPNELNIHFEITALNETFNGQPILATFFDLYEDGVIDILVNYKKEGTNPHSHELKALTLNDFTDVNFVKILVTSGLCTNGNCYERGTYGEDTYLTPYGTNSPGSMVCYQLVNSNSNVMKSCAGQLSQSSNFALQMPYTIFGLGLYANYIEKLSITIPSGNTSVIRQKKVEQIVPDSQIVVIPNPIDNPSAWKVKLFITPSDIIYKTLYTLTGICIILIIIIGVLHRKEMLEDVEEQKLFKKQWPEYRR